MIMDKLLLFSNAQALTATAASTDSIDLGPGAERRIGLGEPMAVVLLITTAAGGTTPTLTANVQSDDNSGFASAATVASSPALAAADMTTGAMYVIPIPPGKLTERYMRMNYTVGGTSPTVSVTAYLIPIAMIQSTFNYAKGYTVS